MQRAQERKKKKRCIHLHNPQHHFALASFLRRSFTACSCERLLLCVTTLTHSSSRIDPAFFIFNEAISRVVCVCMTMQPLGVQTFAHHSRGSEPSVGTVWHGDVAAARHTAHTAPAHKGTLVCIGTAALSALRGRIAAMDEMPSLIWEVCIGFFFPLSSVISLDMFFISSAKHASSS